MASLDRPAGLPPFPLDETPPHLAGGVVAIGNFDGVHRGHQVLLEAARSEAARRGVPSVVLTFEPHPRTVLRPETPVFRLTPLPAKARVLRAAGIDGLVAAHFDRSFAAMSPDEFVETALVHRLRVAGAVIGFNFRYGRGRAGTSETLTAAGQRHQFGVTVVEPVATSGVLVASSDIRQALAAGDVDRANALLGYRWFVLGTVEDGEARGRQLGFPTANLRPPPELGLRHGIYAVRLRRPNGEIHDGVASHGVRPTFGGGAALLEVHLFDFSSELYGEEVAVTFVAWLRPEMKFSGASELVAAIGRDATAARAALAAAAPGSALDRRLAGGSEG